MTSGKATFESRDPSSQTGTKAPSDSPGSTPPTRQRATFDSSDLTAPTSSKNENLHKYMGVERRRIDRRSTAERRADVRFEFGKEDRRKDHGRRDNDKGPDFW